MNHSQPLCQLLLISCIILVLVRTCACDCCRGRMISFQVKYKEHSCSDFDAQLYKDNECRGKICKDGTFVNGRYCGQGACNIFGCRCEGGCREGNGLDDFLNFYGDFHIDQLRYV